MFSVNSFIDVVQASKRSFVSNYITDKEIRETWYAYIDTQTEFVKQAAKTAEFFRKRFGVSRY